MPVNRIDLALFKNIYHKKAKIEPFSFKDPLNAFMCRNILLEVVFEDIFSYPKPITYFLMAPEQCKLLYLRLYRLNLALLKQALEFVVLGFR